MTVWIFIVMSSMSVIVFGVIVIRFGRSRVNLRLTLIARRSNLTLVQRDPRFLVRLSVYFSRGRNMTFHRWNKQLIIMSSIVTALSALLRKTLLSSRFYNNSMYIYLFCFKCKKCKAVPAIERRPMDSQQRHRIINHEELRA